MSDPAALIGTRCPDCGRSFYPVRDLCPTCWRTGLEAAEIPATGELATWTVVRIGKRFPTPYALCYADFPGDVRVLGRVTNWIEGTALRPGMAVHIHPVNAEQDGRTVTTEHTFTVVDEGAH